MKKLLFLFVLALFFSFTSHAQDYEPLLKEGAFWDVHTSEGAAFCDYNKRRYQITTDTLINNRQYKKLKLFTFQGQPNDHFPHICVDPPYHVDPNEFEIVEAFLYEDIAEQKVYIWAKDFPNQTAFQEYVLFDFNVEAGDVINNSYYNNGDPMTIIQVDIDSNGRKKITVGAPINSYTEGIGSEAGIVGLNNIIGEHDTLICWGNNQNQNGCAPVLSIEDYRLSQIKIFPNPASDKVSLTNLENNTFKLFSILGNEVSFQFSNENQEIDISHLNQGVYFLRIQGSNGSKRIVKIIKN